MSWLHSNHVYTSPKTSIWPKVLIVVLFKYLLYMWFKQSLKKQKPAPINYECIIRVIFTRLKFSEVTIVII